MQTAVWPFHWLTTLKGALPPHLISATLFPRVFAWISRFDTAVKAAAQQAGKARTVSGEQAMKQISGDVFAEDEASLTVDRDDPTGLERGLVVEVWPVDSGFSRKDRGVLVGLNGSEIVVEGKTGSGETVRIHKPRHGFRLRGVGGAKI